MKWICVLAAITVIVCCFFPWVIIDSKSIIITGIDASDTNYGKPGYINLLLCSIFIIISFVPSILIKRSNYLVALLNFSWSIRNFILLAGCEAGECPIRQPALYILLGASLCMLVALLFSPLKETKGA